MIMSMTGFGKAQKYFGEVQISIEVKSVNSRFLETSIRLPRQLSAFELDVKEGLKEFISRGKVTVNVNFNGGKSFLSVAKLDTSLVKQYMDIIGEIKDYPGIDGKFSVSDILALPDVVSFDFDEEKERKIKEMLLQVLGQALEEFSKMRSSEGEALAKDMIKRLNLLKDYLGEIELLSSDVVRENVEKLTNRIKEITDFDKFDKDRLEAETVLLADRLDITEEIIRLNTHIDAFRNALDADRHPGKKLNFLAQEMHREANTIGSKSGNVNISHSSVSLKEEIEKIREQVQNIE